MGKLKCQPLCQIPVERRVDELANRGTDSHYTALRATGPAVKRFNGNGMGAAAETDPKQKLAH